MANSEPEGYRVDNYSTAAFPIFLWFKDTPLGHATGSFWAYEGRLFLITNWHVVTARRNDTAVFIDKAKASEPTHLTYFRNSLQAGWSEQTVELVSDDQPLWLVHPEHGRQVDLVAIEVPAQPEPFGQRIINKLPPDPLKTQVGGQLFVLGFPFNPPDRGPGRLPIWKQATLATEPDLTPRIYRRMLIDTASRPGMSGAPVIQRAQGLVATDENKLYTFHNPATKLIGYYSGRLFTHSEMDAQLGIVWPAIFASEIVEGSQRDAVPRDAAQGSAERPESQLFQCP